MRPTARLRVALARHPWIHWSIVIALAAAAALIVRAELVSVAARREAWGRGREVLVADGDQAPGGAVLARPVTLPEPALPDAALTTLPEGALLRQHVVDGEVLVDVDILVASGPAAGAPAGTVVVGVVDPLMRGAGAGDRVVIAADGGLIASSGVIVRVVDDVAFVAVAPGDAPAVAAAARSGSASLVYVP